MAASVNPPRGMRDFLPQEKATRNEILGIILNTYLERGFQEIETPALEAIDRLTSGQGGDNEKLAFRVLKRGEELDAALAAGQELSDLGLRYDLTVPLTRFFATNHAKLPKVVKAIQVGPVWRAERPQKGRYRQFTQCDIDIIGSESISCEVELLLASLDALSALGINDAIVRINHRALLAKAIAEIGLIGEDQLRAMITIDKLDKVGIEGVVQEMKDRFNPEVARATEVWLANAAKVVEFPSELADIAAQVNAIHPGKLRFDATLVRGMGYYTGAIFEIEHPASGSSIGGGGRYDEMVGKFLGQVVPAVGISLGFERVAELVAPKTAPAKSLVLVYDPEHFTRALSVQREAIGDGFRVRLEERPKKLNLLLQSLAEAGFTHFGQLDPNNPTLSGLGIKPIL